MIRLSAEAVETAILLSVQDNTPYYAVQNIDRAISKDFKEKEFFFERNGLEFNPVAQEIVLLAQASRDFFGVPMRVNSAYRNYNPEGGAKYSAHKLGQAIDLAFPISEKVNLRTREQLMIFIREDFQKEGPFFQMLWNLGARGFGIYDTFFHIDIVQSEIYAPFRAKRTRTRVGARYAKWNNMQKLRYKRASKEYPITPNSTEPILNIPAVIIEQENTPTRVESPISLDDVTEPFGEVVGFVGSLVNAEDGRNRWKRAGAFSLFLLALLIVALLYSPLIAMATTK